MLTTSLFLFLVEVLFFFLIRNSYSSDDEDGNGRTRALSFTVQEYQQLQTSYTSVKVELNELAENLGMMCAVYKDMQLARLVKLRIAATGQLN